MKEERLVQRSDAPTDDWLICKDATHSSSVCLAIGVISFSLPGRVVFCLAMFKSSGKAVLICCLVSSLILLRLVKLVWNVREVVRLVDLGFRLSVLVAFLAMNM
jgi:hypothetical protein